MSQVNSIKRLILIKDIHNLKIMAEQVRDLPISGTQQYSGISKFLLCISTERYRTSCCCGLFALRAAIYIFAILDIIIGGVCLAILLAVMNYNNLTKEGLIIFEISLVIDISVAFAAILAIHGAANANAKKVSYYYYAKVGQLITRIIPNILQRRLQCKTASCGFSELFIYILIQALVTTIHIYVAHVIFSYINLVSKGETVLANNGKEVVQKMDEYRHQAAALELQPYPGVVVGSAVQVGESVSIESAKPTQQLLIRNHTKVLFIAFTLAFS
uniref:Uncharacterized protein n=1 Tax=Metopus es TaxID=392813 RepID=A6MI36_9CILI|nr:hypothetical protein [Metopus es]